MKITPEKLSALELEKLRELYQDASPFADARQLLCHIAALDAIVASKNAALARIKSMSSDPLVLESADEGLAT